MVEHNMTMKIMLLEEVLMTGIHLWNNMKEAEYEIIFTTHLNYVNIDIH